MIPLDIIIIKREKDDSFSIRAEAFVKGTTLTALKYNKKGITTLPELREEVNKFLKE